MADGTRPDSKEDATADRKPLPTSAPPEHIFPRLTPAQVARVAARGRLRTVSVGEVLIQAGTPAMRIFVVSSGEIEVVQAADNERLVAVFRAGLPAWMRTSPTLTGRRRPRAATRATWAGVSRGKMCSGGAEVGSGLRSAVASSFESGRVPSATQLDVCSRPRKQCKP